MEKNSLNKSTKANAFLCPSCCVEYIKIKFDFEVNGIILHDVEALRCPTCREEQFTAKQLENIEKRLGDSEKTK